MLGPLKLATSAFDGLVKKFSRISGPRVLGNCGTAPASAPAGVASVSPRRGVATGGRRADFTESVADASPRIVLTESVALFELPVYPAARAAVGSRHVDASPRRQAYGDVHAIGFRI
ncbi:hypothetical protein EVAR_49343_1 [Eumeta japonica]|uniref:Uncharacterized protein n=1 Tax=Eumeta variegata TaxID=151549 RepID=A0A4C1XYQ1_EUMVA|nr:hypothetical protein EVAR_49343_1 [Eumeta japonica]